MTWTPGRGLAGSRHWRPWLVATVTAACVVTAVDGYLLERSKGFFTGGFLADEHLRTWPQRLAFLSLSWLSDAAMVGLVAALAYGALRRLRVGALAWPLAAVAGMAPLAIADFVRFELAHYLGDAFDLGLMFELSGRSPSEFLAVSAGHLAPYAAVVLLVVVLLGVSLWLVWRRAKGRALPPAGPGWRPVVALGLVALGTTSVARMQSPLLDDVLRRKPSVDWPGRFVDRLSDVDRDGYGVFGRPSDPAPFDGRIYPYAIDLPGNGIDEDSVLGDLSPDLPPYEEASGAAPRWTSRRSVVLVMLESVRADAVGATHRGRPVTPTIDGLAARGVASQAAWSHNGYTVQSRHHVFSGSLANLRGGTTLVDDFLANGYQVGYVSGQDDTFGSAALAVGGERADYHYTARQEPHRRYTTFSTPGSLAVPYDVVEEKVAEFLAMRDAARPFFLYVNYHDTHFPYHHRGTTPLVDDAVVAQGEIGPGRQDELRRMYLNAVAHVDASLGRVLARVREAADREVGVIVLSDHGESLYDEGFLGHGYALNEVQTRIPLVVENLPMTIEEPWGQIELRDALVQALVDDPGGPVRPRLVQSEGKGVFQYLGSFNRPRQIGWRTADGTTLYDLRVRRLSPGSNRWLPEPAPPEVAPSFRALVELWERARLAVYQQRIAREEVES